MPSEQTKSSESRTHIIASAQRVLLKDGFDHFTHRAVAEEAGVPLGSTTYHFRDKSELLSLALEGILQEEKLRRRSEQLPATMTPLAVSRYVHSLLIPPGHRTSNKASLLYQRLLQSSSYPGIRESLELDQRDLNEVLSQALSKLNCDIKPATVQAVAEGRLIQWLLTGEPHDWLVRRTADDLAALLKLPKQIS